VVFDIAPAAVEDLLRAGAEQSRSPKDVASRAEVIITMLPISPHVREAVLGNDGVIGGTQAIMVGGDAGRFAQVKEMLLKMGASAVHVGEIGSGNVGPKYSRRRIRRCPRVPNGWSRIGHAPGRRSSREPDRCSSSWTRCRRCAVGAKR